MHVKGCAGASHARRRASGFSLVEAVVASGLLLMTITAVTFCVTSVSASEARLQGVMGADRAIRLVADRLVAAPFYRASSDAGSASDPQIEDLLGVVFPHADVTRNTLMARYVPSDGEDVAAGAFVTVFTEGGVDVQCVARFLVAEDGPPLEPAAIEGWALADGDRPPGCALSLQLKATIHGTARRANFTRAALAMAPVPTATPTAGST
jgi:hypothetical protein